MLGFIALIIPGIYIAARYAFADFETVLNNRSPISALNESWQDTKDIVGKLMIVTALMSGIQVLLGYGFGYIGTLSPTLKILTTLLNDLLSPCTIIFMSIVYFRLYVTNSDSNNETKPS
ncbi:hypothetical protein [Vibrio sp. MEBiC08052]|uniref:hypothetical protein n=1 Tax=Vibrio sp. MEBiC08052 TaxID=1761910 RepID=UPI001E29BEEA|nr:hypothetical protein [Vibrio sp. MEBiC08052]